MQLSLLFLQIKDLRAAGMNINAPVVTLVLI